jgi:hypothetical protein
MTLKLQFGSGLPQYPLKSTPNLHGHYSVRVNPYAHPQHIIVVKHFVYIQYRCGMHSLVGLSFSHDITTSIWLRLTQYPQKSTPNLHRHYSVRVNPYAHPQHIIVVKHFVYIQYGCGMHSLVGLSLNHETTSSLGLRSTSIPPPTCTVITV